MSERMFSPMVRFNGKYVRSDGGHDNHSNPLKELGNIDAGIDRDTVPAITALATTTDDLSEGMLSVMGGLGGETVCCGSALDSQRAGPGSESTRRSGALNNHSKTFKQSKGSAAGSRADNFCRLKGGLSTAQEKSNIKYMRNANASVRLRDEAKTAREKAKETSDKVIRDHS